MSESNSLILNSQVCRKCQWTFLRIHDKVVPLVMNGTWKEMTG